MKNLFVLILLFSFSFSFAQSISWAPNSEVEESLYSSFYGISGDYIGEINNSHFYIYCHLKSLLIPSDDIVFSILKVQNNQVVQSTEFFKKKYNVLKFMIFEDEIAVIYVNDSLDNIHHICIDTYNPNTLQFVKKTQIYSFKPIFGKGNQKHLVISEDKSKIAILTFAINPDIDSYSLFIKVFDNQFNELYETYHSDEFENYIRLGDFCVTNNGTVFLNLNRFTEDPVKKKCKTMFLYMITDNTIKKIPFDFEENIELQDVKFLPNQSNPNTSCFILTEFKKINIFSLDFKTETIDDPISHSTPNGYWKVDQISKLANGNLVFALNNRVINYYVNQNGSAYFYMNKNIHILCLEPSNYYIVYEKSIKRAFYQLEGFLNPIGNIYISPFYLVNQNNFTLIYNTDKDLPNDEDNIERIKVKATPNPITKISVIDEDGKIMDHLLFNSKDEKGTFIPNFSYVGSDFKINICKAKKKKITFGTVNQQN
ncbi:MAG TPA: hypothetical protein PKG88_05200 [Bacteroidales bacterium]|nr:hypothetical protein [Bacteroidales bacterium]